MSRNFNQLGRRSIRPRGPCGADAARITELLGYGAGIGYGGARAARGRIAKAEEVMTGTVWTGPRVSRDRCGIGRDIRRSFPRLAIWTLFTVLILGGCSVQKLAVDVVGDAMTGDSTAFTGDDDPELIKEALPFGLKTYESMLEVSPEHRGLLLASARGFTVYAYLLQRQADELGEAQLDEARKQHRYFQLQSRQ